jgi:predicted dehydrogenase
VQRLRYLLDRDIIGNPYIASVETHWLRGKDYYEAPWRGRWDTERGGVLLGHALHIHDLLCFVLGDVSSVFAQVNTAVNPIETEDCAIASLIMANGALVSSSATLGSHQQLSRLRFCFEHLTAESNHSPYDPGREPWLMTASGRRKDYEIAAALAEFAVPPSGFAGQFMDLYQHLHNGSPLTVSLADARRSLELVTAMYTSAAHGSLEELPVDLSHPRYSDWRSDSGQ